MLYQNKKIIMKKQFLILIFAFFTSSFWAQIDNFKGGYIITNQGDTVFGQIDLRTDITNQEQCTFRKTEGEKPVIYRPFEIQGYRFTDDGKYYVSKNIEIKGDKIDAFVEYLVKGMMNLYYYACKDNSYFFPEDGNKYIDYKGYIEYYFFEDENGKMVSISKKPDKIEDLGYVKEDNNYKGAIRVYFYNVKDIANGADNTEFTQKSMINIAKKYHKAVCTTGEECVVYQRKKPDYNGEIFKIAVYSGVQFTNYHYNYYDYLGYKKKYFPINSFSPIVGLEMTFKNPRWTNQVAFQIDILLSMLYQNKKNLVSPDSHIEVREYKTPAPTIQAGLQYIYPKYKFRPTVGAGFAYSHNFSKEIIPNFLGGYGYLGFDYKVKKNSALIFRLNFKGFAAVRFAVFGAKSDNVYQCEAKIGYAF